MNDFILYIDEVDMFLDPCTCEYNIKNHETRCDKTLVGNLLKYIIYINDPAYKFDLEKDILYMGKLFTNTIVYIKEIINNIQFFNTITKKLKYNKHYGIGHAGIFFNGRQFPYLPLAKPYKYVNVPL